ncbi:MAG: hypothetical protein GX833_04890 [Clostridium sp.]|nr:hypothetical protein [Clostridium sp.]
MAKNELKQKKSIKTEWGKSLPLLVGFIILTVAGFFLLKGMGSEGTLGLILSSGFILLWLVVVVLCVRTRQWLPLLVTGVYWLTTSLVELFIGEVSDRRIADFIQSLSEFAAKPLIGLNQISSELGLFAMAGLTLASLIALIMILDQNKPNPTLKNNQPDSDSTDWF